MLERSHRDDTMSHPFSKCVASVGAGIPTYANTWTLKSPANSGEGAATTGAGKAGPYTATAGSLSYYEVVHDPLSYLLIIISNQTIEVSQ